MKKICVEKERCIGCGACVNIANEYFDFDDEGKSTVIKNDDLDNEIIYVAIGSCPTSAISVVDSEECSCEDTCECEDLCNCGENCSCSESCECGCKEE